MNKEDLIKKAIASRKPIEFEYIREGKISGRRIGNPHILFQSSANEKQVHIFQTGGVSDSNLNEGLPWRLFFVEFIENINILDEEQSFAIAEGYNPDSPMYGDVIAEV